MRKLREFNPNFFVFILFVLVHLLFLNVNAAEWGDTYRLLRAAEFIKSFTYPFDEKRPPLFSALLAFNPAVISPVLWGRIVLFTASVSSFIVFSKLCDFFLDKKAKFIALILFVLNPVYLYWSLRVYADVPFALFVLATLFLYEKWRAELKAYHLFVLGLVTGLAILTRFEGYILFGAVSLALVLVSVKKLVVYALASVLAILPWLIYRNPLNSSYFQEPAGRTYDVRMVAIYIVSLLFVFGFTSAFALLISHKKSVAAFFREHMALLFFVVGELLLILAWPAAIPRLFVPIIPLLIIPIAGSITSYFDSDRRIVTLPILLLGIYVAAQMILKLQFLIVLRWAFAAMLVMQVASIAALYYKKLPVFFVLLVGSLVLWSGATIWIHRDMYITIKSASVYAAKHFSGKVGYNDITSTAEWYMLTAPNVEGSYFDDFSDRLCVSLEEQEIGYLLVTNEDMLGFEFDSTEYECLEVVEKFEAVVNGGEFYTRVYRVVI